MSFKVVKPSINNNNNFKRISHRLSQEFIIKKKTLYLNLNIILDI